MNRLFLKVLICIAAGVLVLELVALCAGVNGTALSTALAILGAIAGFIFRSMFKSKL